MEEQGLTFDEALEAARANNVFTTHTSVPAGIDLFDPGLMYDYFHEYCREVGIDVRPADGAGPPQPAGPRRALLDGHPGPQHLRATATPSAGCTGRSRRRCGTSLWPQLPVWEVPITSITNGVHLPSWLNGDLAALYDQYLQPDWRERFDDPEIWEQVEGHSGRGTVGSAPAPQAAADQLRPRRGSSRRPCAGRPRRRRCGAPREVLDPDALHHRLRAPLRHLQARHAAVPRRRAAEAHPATNQEMPVQIVIAGKAHPKDHPGKS